MAPNYKLTYFDARGIVEPLRYMFAFKEVDYDDHRIKREEWPALKPKTPFGHLPILEFGGQVLAENQAMSRYVAKELGLYGKNSLESAKVDMYLDALKDCFSQRRAFVIETDEAKKEEMKKKFFTEIIPPCLDKLENYLKENGGKHFVGDGFTWADFTIAYALHEIRFNDKSAIFDKYPSLNKHIDFIHGLPQIKAWVEKRPKTEF